MIETGLVYIYSDSSARAFRGCGALIEGGYVATCKHVWKNAAEVYVKFRDENGVAYTSRTVLADACEGLEGPTPDLVLLKPDIIPSSVLKLQLAAEARYEVGKGRARTYLNSRKRYVSVDGTIDQDVYDGLRRFHGDQLQKYWFEGGSSGSPVFLEYGQQLAGIIRLSELGSNEGENRLHEAFVVPATTIYKYLRALIERLAADQQAAKRGIDAGKLRPILAKLGEQDVPDAEIAERLDASVEAILAQAKKPVPVLAKPGEMDVPDGEIAERLDAAAPEAIAAELIAKLDKRDVSDDRIAEWRFCIAGVKAILTKLGEMDVPDDKIVQRLDAAVEAILVQAGNYGADIEAAIKSSRAKLGALDTAGAREVLRAKIAGEAQERARRLVPLLKERAAVERLAFDYDAAKQSLTEVTRLAPDDVWGFIDLGDLFLITGPLEESAKAFRNAEAAARQQGDERDLSVAFNRLGDVQTAQGDLAGALKSYNDGLAIIDRLAKSDSGNAGWQHDLAASYNRIGDVQVAQGDLASALKSYSDLLAITDVLAKSDPGNAGWQRDLSVSYNKVGGVQEAQGDLAAALKSYQDSLAIAERLAKADPRNALWQRDLSVSNERLGDIFLAQGNLPAALEQYRASLERMVPIRDRDPSNAELQRFTSVALNKIGGVQKAQGDLAGALKSYNDDLGIAERLAKSDPGNAGWQRDLAVSLSNLASVYRASGDSTKALDALRQGQAIMARLAKLSPDNAVWKHDLAWFERQIEDLK